MDAFRKYCASITEISKASLTEYVLRRKVLIDILEKTVTLRDDGKFSTEDKIHTIICPMQHTSDDVQFEEMNLWIIDERLAYHTYLASDKTIKSLPYVDSSSTKEPDIAVYDQAFAFSEDIGPFNAISIIEFKKPDNDVANPISQVYKYVDEIKEGRRNRSNGLSFGKVDNTAFYCYIICDFSPKMESYAKDADLTVSSDGGGYFGFNRSHGTYVEIISYPKLLADAKKRNQALFDRLFAPKADTLLTEV